MPKITTLSTAGTMPTAANSTGWGMKNWMGMATAMGKNSAPTQASARSGLSRYKAS